MDISTEDMDITMEDAEAALLGSAQVVDVSGWAPQALGSALPQGFGALRATEVFGVFLNKTTRGVLGGI